VTLTLICEGCGEVYAPADARDVTVVDPGYARYGCPECEYVVRSVPPTATTANETAGSDTIPAIVSIGDSKATTD
jgi:rubredoxin